MTSLRCPGRLNGVGAWLLALLAAVGVLLFGAGTASAHTLPDAGNRVRACAPETITAVGVSEHIAAGQGRGPPVAAARIVVATGVAAEGAGEESVPLFKASQRGLGESHYKNGYRAEDFPGDGAYFAREREIAESYATHYGEGVIETRVPRSVYERNFAEHEMKYLGTPPGTELAVPPGKLELLSQFGRIWHR